MHVICNTNRLSAFKSHGKIMCVWQWSWNMMSMILLSNWFVCRHTLRKHCVYWKIVYLKRTKTMHRNLKFKIFEICLKVFARHKQKYIIPVNEVAQSNISSLRMKRATHIHCYAHLRIQIIWSRIIFVFLFKRKQNINIVDYIRF